MAFSDYKNIAQTQTEFGITYHEESFIIAEDIDPSPNFRMEFEFNRENIDIFTSEGARTELVITPILREVYKQYHTTLSFWIQKSITCSDKLNGTPDYMIATRSDLGKTVLELPLVLVVEAKKNDFEQGWGQCLAELIAAQKMNSNARMPIYGIVTDGELWTFGTLTEDTFTRNIEGYTVSNLAKLFGALHFIFHAISRTTTSM